MAVTNQNTRNENTSWKSCMEMKCMFRYIYNTNDQNTLYRVNTSICVERHRHKIIKQLMNMFTTLICFILAYKKL